MQDFFDRISFKNYSENEIFKWYSKGIREIAEQSNIDSIKLNQFISEQENEIKERAKHPTINDNSPDRLKFRETIVKDYFNIYPNAAKEKRAVILLGQIAAGKSSLSERFSNDLNAMIVDVDFIKQGKGAFEGLRYDFDLGRGTDQVHEEASMLSKIVLSKATDEGYNLVIPKTGLEKSSIEKIVNNLKDNGYIVGVIYVGLPLDKCIQRNIYRFINELSLQKPCRLIPLKTLMMIDDKPFYTFGDLLMNRSQNDIDFFEAYSNDVGMGEEPISIDLNLIIEYINNKNSKQQQ